MRRYVLLVADDRSLLENLRRILRPFREEWHATWVDRAEDAWERLRNGNYDAVVADANAAPLSGLRLLELMQANECTREIPVLVLVGAFDRRTKREALVRGAADLVPKPVEPEDLLARLRNVLRLKTSRDELKAAKARLEERLEEHAAELRRSRLEIVWRLGRVAELHDAYSGNHAIRVGYVSRAIARVLGLNHGFAEGIFLAAPLHDIGKICMPAEILGKRGPLDPQEMAIMKRHCEIGASILREDPMIKHLFSEIHGGQFGPAARVDPTASLLQMAASVALSHHEHYGGGGYPQKLAGEEIPLAARIVAIADAFDALTSHRPYHEAFPDSQARKILKHQSGKQFDPQVYQAFLQVWPEIQTIRRRLADATWSAPDRADRPPEEPCLAPARSASLALQTA